MPSNLGFVMTTKANDGTLIPLYPNTLPSQVIDWNVGEVFGPYQITLSANSWENNQQTVTINGIESTDIPYCVKVLTGTQAEMQAQDKAYSLLLPLTGIESLTNQIIFTCSATPQVDFQVQISWTR